MSMVLAYNASNTIEAQIIKDTLAGEGIAARIDGEYLQGGIGELQALGVVRVMVAPEDLQRARKVLDEWDERPVDAPAPTSDRVKRQSRGVLWGVALGALIALAVVVLSAR